MHYREADSERHQVQYCAAEGSSNEGRTVLHTTTRQQRQQHQQQSSLLNWSDKQSHILTGGGVSSRWYRAPRFPFSEEELPHFHKARGDTHEAFAAWFRQASLCHLRRSDIYVWGKRVIWYVSPGKAFGSSKQNTRHI